MLVSWIWACVLFGYTMSQPQCGWCWKPIFFSPNCELSHFYQWYRIALTLLVRIRHQCVYTQCSQTFICTPNTHINISMQTRREWILHAILSFSDFSHGRHSASTLNLTYIYSDTSYIQPLKCMQTYIHRKRASNK